MAASVSCALAWVCWLLSLLYVFDSAWICLSFHTIGLEIRIQNWILMWWEIDNHGFHKLIFYFSTPHRSINSRRFLPTNLSPTLISKPMEKRKRPINSSNISQRTKNNKLWTLKRRNLTRATQQLPRDIIPRVTYSNWLMVSSSLYTSSPTRASDLMM